MIGFGLLLAAASAVAINGGFALQHAAASHLPPLRLGRPVRSLLSLARNGRWSLGFVGGIGGWALYVFALRLAPLSLVQAASAGGVAVLAVRGRLRRPEKVAVGVAVAGLALLALSLGRHPVQGHAPAHDVVVWLVVSAMVACVAALGLRTGVGLATAAGVLYAAGDVATKSAVAGGARLAFVPAVLAAHGLAFVCLQLAFQRGRRLATAGTAVVWTNALPILAGMLLFAERLPGGWRGDARVAAFALVLAAAAALARPAEPAAA